MILLTDRCCHFVGPIRNLCICVTFSFFSLIPFLGPSEPSYPKGDPSTTARRSWELRTFISQSKGGLALAVQHLLHALPVSFVFQAQNLPAQPLSLFTDEVKYRIPWVVCLCTCYSIIKQ